jgi:hypothetical protein
VFEEGEVSRRNYPASSGLFGVRTKLRPEELGRIAIVKESLTVQREGTRSTQRAVKFFNLDVTISE